MLISLHSSLHNDIVLLIQRFSTEVNFIGDRVDHVKHKMEEFLTTINDLVDTHEESVEDCE